MKKELTLIEISDDVAIRAWAKELMTTRKREAIESIEVEKVEKEIVFIIEIDQKKFLAFYMEGEMLPADINMPINQEHRKILKSIRTRAIDAELLYELSQS